MRLGCCVLNAEGRRDPSAWEKEEQKVGEEERKGKGEGSEK